MKIYEKNERIDKLFILIPAILVCITLISVAIKFTSIILTIICIAIVIGVYKLILKTAFSVLTDYRKYVSSKISLDVFLASIFDPHKVSEIIVPYRFPKKLKE